MLGEERTGEFEHSELEAALDTRGRQLLRQLLQDHLDLRAEREERLPTVRDADQVAHAAVEAGHRRALADGRCESPGESRTRVILHGLGIRDVEPQVVIREGDGRVVARVDFLLGRSPVVIEFDGKIKYDGVNGKQALVDEKVREDRLRALGYEIVRLTWADLARPARVKVMVLAAVQRAHGRGRAPLRAG